MEILEITESEGERKSRNLKPHIYISPGPYVIHSRVLRELSTVWQDHLLYFLIQLSVSEQELYLNNGKSKCNTNEVTRGNSDMFFYKTV